MTKLHCDTGFSVHSARRTPSPFLPALDVAIAQPHLKADRASNGKSAVAGPWDTAADHVCEWPRVPQQRLRALAKHQDAAIRERTR